LTKLEDAAEGNLNNTGKREEDHNHPTSTEHQPEL